MHKRRTGGDNGYQTPEDFANEGRGYEPANNTDINNVIHDRVDTVAQDDKDKKPAGEDKGLPEERNKSREGYDNGSNTSDDTTEGDHRYAASTGKMS